MENETYRTKNVRLNTMTKKHFLVLFTTFASILTILTIIASVLPNRLIERPPNGGQYLDILQMSCGADMINDYGNKTANQCWAHRFIFPDKWSQFFSLDMILHRNGKDLTWGGSKAVNMKILWQGTTSYDKDTGKGDAWVPIADSKVVRNADFTINKVDSSDIIVFKSSSINFQAYYFQILFLDGKSALDFIQNVSFNIHYMYDKWVKIELAVKSTFLGLSILVALVYSLQLSTVKRRLRSYEQSCIKYLVISLVFYNNPFYFLEYILPKYVFGWLDTILQFVFVAGLLLFWLVTFDAMRFDPPFAFQKFYLPKIIFVAIFFVVGIALYLGVKGKEWSDPVFNWYQDQSLYNLVLSYTIITAIFYVGWLSYLIVQGVVQEKNMTSRQKVTFAFHSVVVLCTFIGSLVGSFITAYANNSTDYFYFLTLFNLYVYCLCYMYAPTSSPNVTMEHKDMERAAVPDYGGSIVPTSTKNADGTSKLRARTPGNRGLTNSGANEIEIGGGAVKLMEKKATI